MRKITFFLALMIITFTYYSCAQTRQVYYQGNNRVRVANSDDVYYKLPQRTIVYDNVVNDVQTESNILVNHENVVNYYHNYTTKENHFIINNGGEYVSTHVPIQKYPRGNIVNNGIMIIGNGNTVGGYDETIVRRSDNCGNISFEYKQYSWTFFFGFNSSKITDFVALRDLLNTLYEHPTINVRLDGYGDSNNGGFEANFNIAKARNEAIKQYLIQNGISSRRIYTICIGCVTQPYDTNELNRCVKASLFF